MIRCPNCGKENSFDEVKPDSPENTYVISEAREDPNHPDQIFGGGLPIRVYGCVECKILLFRCESLRPKQASNENS